MYSRAPMLMYRIVTKYLATIPNITYTNLYTSHYFSNLSKFGLLKPDPEKQGGFLLDIVAVDDLQMPHYAVEQTGGWVKEIFNNKETYKGE